MPQPFRRPRRHTSIQLRSPRPAGADPCRHRHDLQTYWIRVNRGDRTHERCVDETRVLSDAAKAAAVRRILHISATNPDPSSPLPYFRSKGQLEDALRELDVSYAVLRPTVLYSTEDILLNNIA